MIALNLHRPNYDLALEIACSLYMGPIELNALTEDFGLQGTKRVAHAVRRLSRRKFPIEVKDSLIGRTVRLTEPMSPEQLAQCERYFDAVCDGEVREPRPKKHPGGRKEAREGCEDAAAGGGS